MYGLMDEEYIHRDLWGMILYDSIEVRYLSFRCVLRIDDVLADILVSV